MFDLDRWREIFQSINKNRLRSVMSGFTVAFAILLFTLLFGISQGLGNFFKEAFADDAQNKLTVNAWKTSKPYKGLQSGRRVQLTNKEYDYVAEEYENKIQYQTARTYQNFSFKYKNKSDTYNVRAVHPDDQFLEQTHIIFGRYLNNKDIDEKAKVVVIGRLIKEDLFGQRPAINKRININGSSFLIIGVFTDDGGDREERIAYIPISTSQMMYGNNDYIGQINLGYNPNLSNSAAIAFGKKLERDLRKKMNIHPDDQSALSVRNRAEANQFISGVKIALVVITIFVGLGTLIAGIIGISNIMIFIIKERTKEFGIRKAIGAKPSSIVGMVVQESILITSISGYIGLSLGVFILNLESLRELLEEYFIVDPDVSLSTILFSTIVLVSSGLIASYIPAKRASKIKPVVALRVD
jgi:putative ABC transport system permease protein